MRAEDEPITLKKKACRPVCRRRLLKESAANRGVIQYTLDLLSIPNYVIKKGRPHGHRYGKTPEKEEYHLAHNLKKRCIKRHFKGIHDRFLRDPEFRRSMLERDRDDDECGQLQGIYIQVKSEYVGTLTMTEI